MNQRVVLIAGVAAVVAAVWLTTRTDESTAVVEQAPSNGSAVTTPSDPVGGVPAPSVVTGDTSSAGTPATLEMRVVSPPQPIEVSPGFEFLSTPDMDDTDGRYPQWRRHQQLQSEMRDPTWAPRVEAALRNGIEDALTAQGFDTQRIVLPVVECRSTGCEIQALQYPADSMKNGADLQLILPPVLSDILRSEIDPDGTNMLLSTRPDERRAIFVELRRKMN